MSVEVEVEVGVEVDVEVEAGGQGAPHAQHDVSLLQVILGDLLGHRGQGERRVAWRGAGRESDRTQRKGGGWGR